MLNNKGHTASTSTSKEPQMLKLFRSSAIYNTCYFHTCHYVPKRPEEDQDQNEKFTKMSHRHKGGGEREQIEEDLCKDKEKMWVLAARQHR